MQFDYEIDPQAIERNSFAMIRELADLSAFDAVQTQVAMRVIHSAGDPALAAQLRFSVGACDAGRRALATQAPILCDVEMLKQGLTKRMLGRPAQCFLNAEGVSAIAQARGETRSMAALEFWGPHLAGSVVIIGNAPTALFRLLEMLASDSSLGRPALVIGIPVGFVGAAESKQALWDCHQTLGIECITLLGRQGGSAIAASVCNALLRCNRGELY